MSLRKRLVVLAALGALVIGAEALMRRRWGTPFPETVWSEFDYHYKEIYEPFFERAVSRERKAVVRTRRKRAEAQEFLAEKPKGLIRVFVLGGSVAIPFAQTHEGIALREILANSLPGRDFEVIGTGMAGYDSLREAMIHREILKYQPDFIVLLSGNNEYYEPVEANPFLYKLTLRLRRYWLFRWPQEAYRDSHPQRPMSREERLEAFEQNVHGMVKRAKERGVPMVLCTLPANVRDSPPLRSRPQYGNEGYMAAWEVFDRGDHRTAAERFGRYAERFPEDPFGHYWLAKAQDRLGRFPEARQSYLQALDFDVPGERATPSRNAVLRKIAREENAALADVEGAFSRLVPHGLIDARLFADPMHWHSRYYPLAALTIAKAIEERNGASGEPLNSVRWDWGWLATKKAGILQPPTVTESGRIESQAFYKALTYVLHSGGEYAEGAVALLESVARANPELLDDLLVSPAKLEQAFLEHPWFGIYRARIHGDWPRVLMHSGEACRRLGRLDQALAYLDRALILDDRLDLALLSRALIHVRAGRPRQAQADFARLSPSSRSRLPISYWLARFPEAGQGTPRP